NLASLSIGLIQERDGARIMTLLDREDIPAISLSSTPPTVHVCVPLSPVILTVHVTDYLGKIILLVDGKPWPIETWHTSSARMRLQEDAETHLLTCVIDGRFALCVSIDVLAYFPLDAEQTVMTAKWMRWQFARVLKEYNAQRRGTRRAGLEFVPRAVGPG